MIVNSGKRPCGVRGKGVQSNSLGVHAIKSRFISGGVVCVGTGCL